MHQHDRVQSTAHACSPQICFNAASSVGSPARCAYVTSTVRALIHPPSSATALVLPPVASVKAVAQVWRKACGLISPQACTAAGTLEHLPSTVCAQGITCMLADELDQDEFRMGQHSYPVVVLGEVLVVAGDHCKAYAANSASRDDAVDYYGWESRLRTGT